jgi:hypothetical protein
VRLGGRQEAGIGQNGVQRGSERRGQGQGPALRLCGGTGGEQRLHGGDIGCGERLGIDLDSLMALEGVAQAGRDFCREFDTCITRQDMRVVLLPGHGHDRGWFIPMVDILSLYRDVLMGRVWRKWVLFTPLCLAVPGCTMCSPYSHPAYYYICIDDLTDGYLSREMRKIEIQVLLFNVQINRVNSLFFLNRG